MTPLLWLAIAVTSSVTHTATASFNASGSQCTCNVTYASNGTAAWLRETATCISSLDQPYFQSGCYCINHNNAINCPAGVAVSASFTDASNLTFAYCDANFWGNQTIDWGCQGAPGLNQGHHVIETYSQSVSGNASSPSYAVTCTLVHAETPCTTSVPVPCVLSNWSSWSACNTSCGGTGYQTMSRTVLQPALNGAPCNTSNMSMMRACAGPTCPLVNQTSANIVPLLACATDSECVRVHQGQCWNAIGNGVTTSTSVGVCLCPPGQQRSLDLGVCEPPYPNVSALTYGLFSAPLPYYETAFDVNRFGAVPTWPLGPWECDPQRCLVASESPNAFFAVSPPSLLLSTGALSPLNVYVRCTGGARFFQASFAAATKESHNSPPHSDHCVTCSQWCGAHGNCSDPVAFTCVCAPGWTGDRCNVQSALLSIVPTGAAPVAALPAVFTAPTLFAFAIQNAYRNYTANRPCVSDAGCGLYERCFLDVTRSRSGSIGVCFCDEGHAPSTTNKTDCVAVDSTPVFGVITSNARPTMGTAVGPLAAASGVYLLFLHSGSGLVVTAAAVDLTPQSRLSLRADAVYVACDSGAVPSSAVTTALADPVAWCDACGVRCNGDPCDPTTGACLCRNGRSGPSCGTCALADQFVYPDCNVTLATCRAQRCSGHGACLGDGSCRCDANSTYTGADCSILLSRCGADTCNGHGRCQPYNQTVCACNAGWTGVRCNVEQYRCNARLCNDHGTCDQTTTRCTCNDGYTGINCDTMACSRFGAFNATTGACVCATPDWTGPLCNVSVCGYNGAVDPNTGTCACRGMWQPNTTVATNICGSNHTCGRGTPVANGTRCLCPTGYYEDILFMPSCRPVVTAAVAQAFPSLDSRPTTTHRTLVYAICVGPAALVVLVNAFAHCRRRHRTGKDTKESNSPEMDLPLFEENEG